ncbi:2-amino-4-hydroxy-6-hydroxymethyldihydropteridine diphosphokinase [Rhodobacteraceae bacterium WD3A24]|nr:2-amino-4-hydroxy-6-hydroxymethyldihydropteridine diphosphokinase [Rhodobacteraceae bacterium WD3A24]
MSGRALIALGANLASTAGPPEATLRAALEMLAVDPDLRPVRASRLYRTPCFPSGAGPDYVNAAAELNTTLEAEALLARLHAIEARFGRARGERWGQRTLDLDLLAIGQAVLPDAHTQAAWRGLTPSAQIRRTPGGLILPHPRLQDRGFVLIPLAEIAPRWRHPLLDLDVCAMRDALPAARRAEIHPL